MIYVARFEAMSALVFSPIIAARAAHSFANLKSRGATPLKEARSNDATVALAELGKT
jgi:hypothetical protein